MSIVKVGLIAVGGYIAYKMFVEPGRIRDRIVDRIQNTSDGSQMEDPRRDGSQMEDPRRDGGPMKRNFYIGPPVYQ